MYRPWLAICAMLVLTSFAAFADVGGPAATPFWGFEDTYQACYFSATNTNDGVLNLVNTGAYTPPITNINTGYLCANVYVFAGNTAFDPDREQMQACCTCPMSRNGSRSIRAQQLLSNPINVGPFTSATVKVVWTRPANDNPNNCTATALPGTNTLVRPPAGVGAVPPEGGFATGGRSWATHWHAGLPAPPGGVATPAFGTEIQCKYSPLSANESSMLSSVCNTLWFTVGSGSGRCPACPTSGTQGAVGSAR